jgi:short subunit dehydrogenase-like uncharacterized protein
VSAQVEAAIVVFGAAGLVGRRICGALARAKVPFEIAGRSSVALDAIAAEFPVAHVHLADATDALSLGRAFAGARVIINAAAPLGETAPAVLDAAITAGAHYVDVGGEQGVLHALYEQHESTARRAGLVALPGAGVDSVLGDLGAAWAAEYLVGAVDQDPSGPVKKSAPDRSAVRFEPMERIATNEPLDEVITTYVFDDLVLSAGSQRALFAGSAQKPLVWRRDRWEEGRAGDRRRVNAGTAFGGERDAICYAGNDVLAVPRHVAANLVASYVSTTRNAGAARALGLLARALPFVPKAATELLAPYADPNADYSRTRFAVITQVRRGFSAAQIVMRGHDLYATTAAIVAWCARALATRSAGPTGMRAPGELFHAAAALRALSSEAGLVIEPSFG